MVIIHTVILFLHSLSQNLLTISTCYYLKILIHKQWLLELILIKFISKVWKDVPTDLANSSSQTNNQTTYWSCTGQFVDRKGVGMVSYCIYREFNLQYFWFLLKDCLVNVVMKSVVFCLLARFGEESMDRVLQWMDKAEIQENAAILDIGTGNGVFLVELVRIE